MEENNIKTLINHYLLLLKNSDKNAEDYYYQQLFPKIIERFVKRYQQEFTNYIGCNLISLVGYSPQPIILFIKLLKPRRVYFITTENSQNNSIDIIIRYTGLKPSQYVTHIIDDREDMAIYDYIKNIKENNSGPIFLDITGGKKSMVGSAVVAGSYFNLTMGYIDYDEYLKQFRKPFPGTEFPRVLANPIEYYQTLELEKIDTLYKKINFSAIIHQIDNLQKNLNRFSNTYLKFELIKTLSMFYEKWFNFRFNDAFGFMKGYLSNFPNCNKILSQQLNILNQLIQGNEKYLFWNFYYLAKQYADNLMFNISTLLYYRSIEQLGKIILEAYGFDLEKPNYEKFNITKEAYNNVLKTLFKDYYYETDLPKQLGLINMYIIIHLQNKIDIETLKEIKNNTEFRNKSYLAHGFNPVDKKGNNKIKKILDKLIEKNSDLIKIEIDHSVFYPINYRRCQ